MFELTGGYGTAGTQAGAPAPPWTEASEAHILGLVPPCTDQINGLSHRPAACWPLHLAPSQDLPHQLDTLILLACFHNQEHKCLPYRNSVPMPLEQNICYQDRQDKKKNQIKLLCSLDSVLVSRKQEIQDFYVR